MGIPESVLIPLIVGLAGTGASVGAAVATRPDAPDAPRAPRVRTSSEMQQSAADAADRRRKQALAAFGRSDTILTGPSGLGGQAEGVRKTLLGS